jgi:hypothetical protein
VYPACICSAETFIGDYFGIDSAGGDTFISSASTFNCAEAKTHRSTSRRPSPS